MSAPTPATSAAANEVPKFASSRMASTGSMLSLSRLLQTACEMVFGALKKPVPSAATPTTSGAVRRDPAVAGPLEEKFRTFSSRLPENAVCKSWECPTTETRFLAVAGGDTCSGLLGSLAGHGTVQLSASGPSNRSGY